MIRLIRKRRLPLAKLRYVYIVGQRNSANRIAAAKMLRNFQWLATKRITALISLPPCLGPMMQELIRCDFRLPLSSEDTARGWERQERTRSESGHLHFDAAGRADGQPDGGVMVRLGEVTGAARRATT